METHLIQGSQEWLTARKSGLGASEAAVILGLSPWKTPMQLWEEKLGFRLPTKENEAMRRGKELESKALEEYCRLTGIDMVPVTYTHDDYSWMMCSMDGINKEKMIGVEIKCGGAKSHKIALDGVIVDHYYSQIQHQYAVTGASQIDYFSFDGSEGIILKCPRDDAYIADLIEKEQQFWDCVQNLEPPPLSDKDYVQCEDDVCIETAERLLAIQKKISEMEKEAKELKNQLILASNCQNTMYGDIRFSKSLRKGNVQYTKIPELKGVDLEKYRSPTIEVWRLSGG